MYKENAKKLIRLISLETNKQRNLKAIRGGLGAAYHLYRDLNIHIYIYIHMFTNYAFKNNLDFQKQALDVHPCGKDFF